MMIFLRDDTAHKPQDNMSYTICQDGRVILQKPKRDQRKCKGNYNSNAFS